MDEKKGIPGLRVWKNKGNGFTVCELHYTADPAKRTKEWKRQAKSGMTQKAWDTEFEISWEVYSGQPVFGKEFNKDLHVLKTRREPDPEYPILRGWDFGGNHAVVTAQVIGGCLYLLDEWPTLGYNTRRIGQEIISDCHALYPEINHYVDYVDPSGLWDNSKAAEGKACAQILKEVYSLKVVPGIQSVTKRIDSVMYLLTTIKEGKPLIQINPELPITIQAFQSAYAYPENPPKNVKANRPEKTHPYSDLMDCIQYIATKTTGNSKSEEVSSFLEDFDDGAIRF